MTRFSITRLAERWNASHTLAVIAWAVVAVLGLTLFVRNNSSTYPSVGRLKTYAAENATFNYPANWTLNNCEPGKPFMELPGTIRTNYKHKRYQLKIYGTTAFGCMKDRPERLDLSPENLVASSAPCAPASSTEGERLSNGLYLQLVRERGDVVSAQIRQNRCYVRSDTVVLAFSFTDPNPEAGDSLMYGLPRVPEVTFLESQQYTDIKALAESIKY